MSELGDIQLCDSHCHFDFPEFDIDRNTLWQQCQNQGVNTLIIPGVSPESLDKAKAIAESQPGIYLASGIHPWWINTKQPNIRRLEESIAHQASHKKCLAIGECGLDTAIDTPLNVQSELLERQILLAKDFALPCILHVRGAHNTLIRLLKKHFPKQKNALQSDNSINGVIHAFTGSFELATTYIALGFKLGVGGSISYPRAHKTRTTLAKVPSEALVLETDAPDMPLHGFQGQRNTPVQLPHILKILAQLRHENIPSLGQQTHINTCELFNYDF